jgi:hypothetical protein
MFSPGREVLVKEKETSANAAINIDLNRKRVDSFINRSFCGNSDAWFFDRAMEGSRAFRKDRTL